MIRHLLKLSWNRKRANALIIAEIFLSFLVLFGVATAATELIRSYGAPLGFEYENVWDLDLTNMSPREDGASDKVPQLARMIAEAEAMPEVIAAGGARTPAYSFSTNDGVWHVEGRTVRVVFDDVTDGYGEAMQVKLVRGRWFRREDDAAGFRPVVLDANAARALYGDKDPIGQKFDPDSEREMRVVGIIEPFRKDGEFSSDVNMIFRRTALDGGHDRMPTSVVVRLQPGTPASFEETLVKRLQAVAPDLTFRVRHMRDMRRSSMRLRTAPLVAGSIVGLFLIAMVALGLTGVLWQNVTRRTRELGLRRAVGAAGKAVRRQILGEVAVLSAIATLIGIVVVLQLPILGIFSWVTPSSFALALAASLATIYALTLLCGLYPSWLASKVQPADALRYE